MGFHSDNPCVSNSQTYYNNFSDIGGAFKLVRIFPKSRSKYKAVFSYLAGIILLAVVYHAAARLGLQMAFVQENTSPVWPPSGIALAALLLFGYRYWPGITIGVTLGSLLTGAPFTLALGLGVGNTLEPLIGVFLLQRMLDFHPSLNRIRDVVGLALAATISTTVSATIGVYTVLHFGSDGQTGFSTLWTTWWIGNLLGILVVTPFLLVWIKRFPKRWMLSTYLEAAGFMIALILVTGYIFGNLSGNGALHQALVYVIFPFAIWAALRLEQIGATTTALTVSGIAIWGTVHGLGPFSPLPLNESLILLQTFMAVVSLTSLTLASSASERRHAEDKLHRRVEDLAALNETSKEFLGKINKQALYESICQLAVERFGLFAAWMVPLDPDKVIPEPEVSCIRELKDRDLLEDLPNKSTNIQELILTAQRSGQVEFASLSDFGQILETPKTNSSSNLSFAAFPLYYAKEVMGVLVLTSDDQEAFSKEHILLLQSFTNLAAAAIQNSWLFDQVRLGNEQLHALSRRLMEVQENERIHLSHELHDETGQILSALMVKLGLLERDAGSADLIRSHVLELKQIISEVVSSLHNLAIKLRPASLDHLGLVTALQQYVDEFTRHYHIEVQFEAVGLEKRRLPGEIETAIFRIVQESLTNVALHAHASQVDVLLNRRNSSIVLTVEDNGIGFNPNLIADGNRLGLFGMRERVDMLGGSFVIESSPGKGTTVVVEVPYADQSPDSR
jgi:signal transduction histidine kinase